MLIVSADAGGAVPREEKLLPRVRHRLVYGGELDGFDNYDDAVAAQSAEPLDSQPRGQDMLYSSGTTGRPKGIKPALPEGEVDTTMDPYTAVFAPMYGFDSDTVYLCPAPLYHAAPLRFCGTINPVGGTVILMDRFEAEEALGLIEEYRVTHSQWVPTMFVRMLKLPEGRSRPVRRVESEGGDPRGGAVPARSEAFDDRLVGAGDPRVLRVHRGLRRHVHRQRAGPRASGFGRP